MLSGRLSFGSISDPQIFSSPADYASKQFGAFITYNMMTYTGNTLADQDPSVSPNTFNPTSLNTDQWAATYATAGIKYAHLVARHGQGFCLWPTSTVSFNIAQSSWYAAHGNYDVVQGFVNSMRSHGIIPCLYLATTDLSFELYWSTRGGFTQAMYLAHIKAQLTELLTNYGAIGA